MTRQATARHLSPRWAAALLAAASLLTGCQGPSPASGSGSDSSRTVRSPSPAWLPPTGLNQRLAEHPQRAACPDGLPASTHCLTGQDALGAYWWIAVPAQWDGVLVMHAHGGPELGAPKPERSAEDLKRWKVMVQAGHAWAGSTFRQGGVAVRAAAEDTERLRQWAVQVLGTPRRTILHGQSWGASVAAMAADMYPLSQDGVLLTSGVLGGGTRSYDFRLDLRVVYQALCHNHPAPDEPAYPLWMGLPADSRLTRAELARRFHACTGLDRPAAERSPQQVRIIQALQAQAQLPERSLLPHLNWATWHFQDIVHKRLGGANPFGNQGVHYRNIEGLPDLNAQVQRYSANPTAVRALAADTDPTGRILQPVISLRGIDDATAFVELDTVFAQAMESQGHGANLLQTYARSAEHSYLQDAEYIAALNSLLQWIEDGQRPSPHQVAQRCQAALPQWPSACTIEPDYRPKSLAERVPAR